MQATAGPREKGSNTAAGEGLHRKPLLRRLVLPLLRRIGDRDIRIKHHWVPDQPVKLHLFRHKAYWYHGRKREKAAMASFARLIKPGDTVIELGGHIGYITLHFAHLVGPTGRVVVFEPSPANLPYLEANTATIPQITIVRKAVSNECGTAKFHVEGITGQNDTLVDEYGVFAANRDRAFSEAGYSDVEVTTTTLDAYLAREGIKPDFIKIDIEGAELLALQGMSRCLAEDRPKLMVEVTRSVDMVMALLKAAHYKWFNGRLEPVEDGDACGPNRFFLPEGQMEG